jgi:hypothetical protein
VFATASISTSISTSIFHDRPWWRVEARRVGSDWHGIAPLAWHHPGWREAALWYREQRERGGL